MNVRETYNLSDEDTYCYRLMQEQKEALEAAGETPPPPFEPLAPFFAIPEKGEFPADALPGPVSTYVKELADDTQTSVDMAGTCALAVLALCCQGKASILCKPGWIEPLNLFCIVVASPGERKSAVISSVTGCISDFEKDQNELLRPEVERSQSEWKTLEKRRESLINKLAKGEDEALRADLEEVTEQIAAFEAVRPVRLLADDSTPEALTKLLADSGGSIGVFSSEGGVFDILSGARFNNSANIDVFLKGHAGDSIRVDRLNRTPEFIPHPALTVLLMVQPDVIKECIGNQTFLRRGLMARFLVSWPDSRTGNRVYDTPPVDPVTRSKYEAVIYQLLAITPGEKPFLLRLSAEAQQSAKQFFEDLEPRLSGELSQMYGWPNKLHGAIMRLAGIIHLAADPERGTETEIGLMEYLKAQTIGYYFLAHAQRLFTVEDAETTRAEKALKKLEALTAEYGVTVFTRETVRQKTRRIFRDAGGRNALDNALGELIDRGYLRSWTGQAEGAGRPTTYYELRREKGG